MNSNSNPRNPNTSSVGNYQFDFGIASNRPSSTRSLNDQKNQHQNPTYSFSPSPPSNPTSSSKAPNKPSWTHQPTPSPAPRSDLSNPTSMVGDIFGKTWGSTTPSSTTTTRIGIADRNPDLFGDLLGTALGQGKSSSSSSSSTVPLKNMTASVAEPQRNSYSMGNLADSLPKTGNPLKKSSWESGENFGSFSTGNNSSSSNKSGSFSGMRSGTGMSVNSKKDPFGSLVDFGSKQPPIGNSSSSDKNNSSTSEFSFGDFQNAPKASNSASVPKMDDFGIPNQDFTSQMPPPPPPPESKGGDPFDMLFSSSSSSAAAASGSTAASASGGVGSKPFSEIDDWGLDSEFGGNDMDSGSGTIELEGLPPPPAGVTASMAKGKGLDHHKQGQYADAIKWLSWAVVLLEKAGDDAATVEILSCRASCYKEVGEYKKAVSDCSKILEQDSTNVSVLLQRALLYESSEKYKLGADDLRDVLKIDPGNRLAKSTIHRLVKLAN